MASLVDEGEVAELVRQYGQPLRRQMELEIGVELFFSRFMRAGDRRGEVVAALERPNGRLLLHRKAHYGADTFRLPTGGIGHAETVLDALHREILEETGLEVTVQRFLAILEYRLCFGELNLPFASYVFHVREAGGRLSSAGSEISGLREVLPAELPVVAQALRTIPGERGYWGRWRAVAHEIVWTVFDDTLTAS